MKTSTKTLSLLAVAGMITGLTVSPLMADPGTLVKGKGIVLGADDSCNGNDACDGKAGCDGSDKEKDSCEAKDSCDNKTE